MSFNGVMCYSLHEGLQAIEPASGPSVIIWTSLVPYSCPWGLVDAGLVECLDSRGVLAAVEYARSQGGGDVKKAGHSPYMAPLLIHLTCISPRCPFTLPVAVAPAPCLLPIPKARHVKVVSHGPGLLRLGGVPRARSRRPASHGPLVGFLRDHVAGVRECIALNHQRGDDEPPLKSSQSMRANRHSYTDIHDVITMSLVINQRLLSSIGSQVFHLVFLASHTLTHTITSYQIGLIDFIMVMPCMTGQLLLPRPGSYDIDQRPGQ